MNFLLFFTAAFMMGFIAAIPAGPVQIEVVRRAIAGHMKAALMVVIGALCADVFYGAIAFFGIAPFLEEKKVMAIFWLAGGFILIILGTIVIKHSLKTKEENYNAAYLRKKRWSFLGGLSLSVTNPMMVLWWLSGVKIFKDVGLITRFVPDIALFYLIAGSLGIACYLVGLSMFLYWAKRFVSTRAIRNINLGFGVLLLAIAFYFFFTSLRNLLYP
jgi:threonine/homoserine/homoserine lactone efflux protein